MVRFKLRPKRESVPPTPADALLSEFFDSRTFRRLKAPLKVAVGIVTAGRLELLSETLCELSRQTPDVVFVCPASEHDIDRRSAARLPFPFRIGRRGSCAQRNAIIDVSQGLDVLVFLMMISYPVET
jgi:hypothetical protein